MKKRIYLSPPHMGGLEFEFVKEAFASNYIAPVGSQINHFEKELAEYVGAKYAVAVSSGTAALHLALRYAGVNRGDEVLCSSFTFVAPANAILYLGGVPVFIDSDWLSWNMDPDLLVETLKTKAKMNQLPKAIVLVHLYGQSADITPIVEACDVYGVPLIEDAAEALGATYKGGMPGTYGLAGIYSFNGNKIITTSGGGMLVSNDKELIDKVRYWSTQALDDAPHYEHSEMGYNYRMSNVLAGIGRGQLRVLNERIKKRRYILRRYEEALGSLPGVVFMPEPKFGRSTRWLTCLLVDPEVAGTNRDYIIERLASENIESRPTWKPMHMQKLFRGCEVVGGQVSSSIFRQGICLPSGTAMSEEDLQEVIAIVKNCVNI